jgi:hypothetical protein
MLYLESNQIGDIGAEYLADVLKNNEVIYFVNIFYFSLTFTFFIQTLIGLNLESNQIGDIGADYFADVLENNQVIYFVNIFYSLLTFTLSFRHLLYFILNRIKSDIVEYYICIMP